jgi:shikimate dehydrogenase
LFIVERDAARGEALCVDLVAQGIRAECLTPEAADQRFVHFDGIVNCTPVGHINHPGCPIDAARISARQWVFDAVYIPARTLLLQAAEAAGAATLSGVDLFVYQGVDAFRFFAEGQVATERINAVIADIRTHYFDKLLGA